MELRLDGKVALVTGGSRGIGRAIAAAFAEAGARVMISSRKADALEAAAADMKGEVEWFAANAGDEEQAQACIDATVERLGGLDILVNKAAANPYFGTMIDINQGQADKTVQVNQWAIVMWSRVAWYAAMQERGGSILNLASIGGLSVEPGIGYYSVTLAAVLPLTKQVAAERAPSVRVTALAAGQVKAGFARALWEPAGDDVA